MDVLILASLVDLFGIIAKAIDPIGAGRRFQGVRFPLQGGKVQVFGVFGQLLDARKALFRFFNKKLDQVPTGIGADIVKKLIQCFYIQHCFPRNSQIGLFIVADEGAKGNVKLVTTVQEGQFNQAGCTGNLGPDFTEKLNRGI